MPLLPIVARSVPSGPMILPHPLSQLDAPRHHSLVMLVVVMGLMLVLLMLKPKLRPLVPLLRSSFLVLVMFPPSILLKKLLIKKDRPLLMMCAP